MLRFASFIDKLNDSIGKAWAFCLLPLTAMLTFEVIMRYVFNMPTIWAHDVSGLLFVTMFAFGGAYALRHGAHVRVDMFTNKLSPRGQAITNILITPLLLMMLAVFIWSGWLQSVKSLAMMERGESFFGPPLYPMKILVLVATFLFALQALAKLARDIHTAITGRQQND
ncbi:MAG: TRAP transporter small permease subunit [Dehalococcoidales bacterium]|nr:TRAP transporter small permease subunit [Dehalococcoidales bacterium]